MSFLLPGGGTKHGHARALEAWACSGKGGWVNWKNGCRRWAWLPWLLASGVAWAFDAGQALHMGRLWGSRPNIIVIITDDQGWGELSCC